MKAIEGTNPWTAYNLEGAKLAESLPYIDEEPDKMTYKNIKKQIRREIKKMKPEDVNKIDEMFNYPQTPTLDKIEIEDLGKRISENENSENFVPLKEKELKAKIKKDKNFSKNYIKKLATIFTQKKNE